ncbi:hypothetical protein CYMTET_6342 [Cymbomonas tetramitiformis]|uniref:Formate/nitrite transporter n=1 Tax=Cymbomonas tetramitiformis TaxID=36881 RepID=A0AAE0LI04_9CHLO|nr:hypothetical protein CYMTET_6342 [Cymbomonas tetramitiformis]
MNSARNSPHLSIPVAHGCGSRNFFSTGSSRSDEHDAGAVDSGALEVKQAPLESLRKPPTPEKTQRLILSTSLDPASTMTALLEGGLRKGERPVGQIAASSLLAGSYLTFGGMMMLTVAGGSTELLSAAPGLHSLAGALVFPVGLALITLTGTDLFTSNVMFTSLPFLSQPEKFEENREAFVKVCGVSYLANFASSLAMAYCCASMFQPGAVAHPFLMGLAAKKCSLPFMTAVAKATGANWLVNLAVYGAASSLSTPGKLLAVWLPITTFVTLGLEHSIANMFLIPLAIFAGSPITFTEFMINNLAPVTVGNMIGAIGFVSMFQWYALVPNKNCRK